MQASNPNLASDPLLGFMQASKPNLASCSILGNFLWKLLNLVKILSDAFIEREVFHIAVAVHPKQTHLATICLLSFLMSVKMLI